MYYALLAHVICFSLAVFPPASAVETQKSSQMEKDILRIKIEQSVKFTPNSLFFAGSSSIRFWRTLVNDFSPLETISRKLPGSTLEDYTRYARYIISPYRPAVVVLSAGDNDIAAGNSPEKVLGDFKRLVAELRKDLPSSPIVFMSLNPSPARWELWGKMQRANELVRKYTEGRKDLIYIDVSAPLFDKGGVIRSELFLGDRRYLNAEGYRLWTLILKPKLTELMKLSRRSTGNLFLTYPEHPGIPSR